MNARRSIYRVAALVLTQVSVPSWAVDEDPCAFPEYADGIARTEKLIEEAAPLIIGTHVLMPTVDRTCIVIGFDISGEGRAVFPQVMASWPNERLARSAFRTLSQYKFKVPEGRYLHTYYLPFEESVENLEKMGRRM